VIAEEDWDSFMEVARSPLPMTFRITSSRDSSQAVNDHVKNEFVPHLSDVVFNGEKQAPPKVLEWYPAGLAWQIDVAKQVIRKSKEFAKSVFTCFNTPCSSLNFVNPTDSSSSLCMRQTL